MARWGRRRARPPEGAARPEWRGAAERRFFLSGPVKHLESDPGPGGEPAPAVAAASRHDPYAALREPNYRRFAAGWVLSSTGLQMMSTAIAWEVYERTGDALALGLIGLARALPVLVFALPAGHVIDLVNRKTVLIATQLAFAGAASLLALASAQAWPMWAVYALLVLSGCARVFNGPSRATLLPLLVRPGTFHNAVTWNSGVFQFSAMGGPLIAGAMIAATGQAWLVYAATAGSCLAFALLATRLSPRPQTIVRDGRGFTIAGVFEGARHIWREKTILGALTLDLFAVLLGGATALLPIYAKDILHVGPVGLGALKAAPYLGALAMAVWLAHRPPMRRAGRALLLSVAGFGLCTIGFGLSTSFWLSLAFLAALGALDNISVVVRHVLVQVRTPDHMRGRVSSVNSVFIESSNELGAFESGLVAKFFGPVVSAVSGGIGTILVVIGVAAIWPQLRRLGSLDELTHSEPAPGAAARQDARSAQEAPGEVRPVLP